MAFPRSDYELEQAQGRWWVVIRERDIRMLGHDDLRMEVVKRVGPFATADHARRFADTDVPVRYEEKFGDIYDERGVYLGSSLRQAAKHLGIAYNAVNQRIINTPDGRRVVREKRPRGWSIGRVVTEEGRYLGSSINHAAKQLGITRAAVYSRVVHRHDDGTVVVKISGIRRKKDGRVELV